MMLHKEDVPAHEDKIRYEIRNMHTMLKCYNMLCDEQKLVHLKWYGACKHDVHMGTYT